jgi:ferredoxin
MIGALPSARSGEVLPEKRSYGSDYPFRNVGQLSGVQTTGVNPALISAAYGGFSNVWGAQVMPFTDETFASWPVSGAEMKSHYKAILQRIPFAAVEDELTQRFPLLVSSGGLPPLGERTERVLDRYRRQRRTLAKHGVTVGRARLAMNAAPCIRCGMCMTGCPRNLIYSASQTFDAWHRDGDVTYRSGYEVQRVEEVDDRVTVFLRDVGSGRCEKLEARTVFVACGTMGSTRLMGSSLGLFGLESTIQEAAQIVLPMISRRPTHDPRGQEDFTLNQFNIFLDVGPESRDAMLFHYYGYNPSFIGALPPLLRTAPMGRALAGLLRRLSVSLGYLPSWASPRLLFKIEEPSDSGRLSGISLRHEEWDWRHSLMLRQGLMKLLRAGRALDLWPVLPQLAMASSGKSYHWGGSFPHEGPARGRFTSDRLGRVAPFKRVHLVDASVFPNVPATTFTLTIMANAHRISSEVLQAGSDVA